MFDDLPKPKKPHEIGMPLEVLSVAELRERIGLLQAEIARLEAAITAKETSRSAADAAFKF